MEAQWQQGGAAPVGKQPEVPDAHKSPRQHVQKKAAQEFLHRVAPKLLMCRAATLRAEACEH